MQAATHRGAQHDLPGENGGRWVGVQSHMRQPHCLVVLGGQLSKPADSWLGSLARFFIKAERGHLLFCLSVQVPGLLQCLCKALETSGSTLGDVAPLGWLALNTALHVQGARQNEAIGRMAEALATHEGAAARAAAQIRVLLAPAQSTTASAQPMDVDGPADAAAESDAAFVAVDDLWQTAGGRHDNDHNDYREIQIMVTSQEVRGGCGLCWWWCGRCRVVYQLSVRWNMALFLLKSMTLQPSHTVFTSLVPAAAAAAAIHNTPTGQVPAPSLPAPQQRQPPAAGLMPRGSAARQAVQAAACGLCGASDSRAQASRPGR